MTEKKFAINKLTTVLYKVLHPWEKELWTPQDSKFKKYAIYATICISTFGTVPSLSLLIDAFKFFWKKYQVKQIKKNNDPTTIKTDQIYKEKKSTLTRQKKKNDLDKLKKDATTSNDKLLTDASIKKQSGEINQKMMDDIKQFWTSLANQLPTLNDEIILKQIKEKSISHLIEEIEKKREEQVVKIKLKLNEKTNQMSTKKFKSNALLKTYTEKDLEKVGRNDNVSLEELKNWLQELEKPPEEELQPEEKLIEIEIKRNEKANELKNKINERLDEFKKIKWNSQREPLMISKVDFIKKVIEGRIKKYSELDLENQEKLKAISLADLEKGLEELKDSVNLMMGNLLLMVNGIADTFYRSIRFMFEEDSLDIDKDSKKFEEEFDEELEKLKQVVPEMIEDELIKFGMKLYQTLFEQVEEEIKIEKELGIFKNKKKLNDEENLKEKVKTVLNAIADQIFKDYRENKIDQDLKDDLDSEILTRLNQLETYPQADLKKIKNWSVEDLKEEVINQRKALKNTLDDLLSVEVDTLTENESETPQKNLITINFLKEFKVSFKDTTIISLKRYEEAPLEMVNLLNAIDDYYGEVYRAIIDHLKKTGLKEETLSQDEKKKIDEAIEIIVIPKELANRSKELIKKLVDDAITEATKNNKNFNVN